jgi:hypothetical protein
VNRKAAASAAYSRLTVRDPTRSTSVRARAWRITPVASDGSSSNWRAHLRRKSSSIASVSSMLKWSDVLYPRPRTTSKRSLTI